MAAGEEVNVVFGAQIGDFVSHVAQIREILQGLSNPLRALRTNLGELAEAFAAAFAIEKISQFIERISEMGAEVEHATHELGMSAEEITGITTAFTLMGMSTERGIFSLERLERSMVTARNSTGPAAQAFTALGIPLDNLKNMKPEDVLGRMADVFSKTADGANKTALAIALFGRAGANMIPWLDRGREGLEEFKRVAEETGVNMSGAMVEGMEQTKIAMSTLGLAFKGLEITVYEGFKPQFDTVIKLLIQFVEWVNNSIKAGGLFNQVLAVMAVITGGVLIGILGIIDALRAFVTGLAAFFDAAEALWPVFMAIVTEFTKLIVTKLSGLWQALFEYISQGWSIVSQAGADALTALLDFINPMIRKMSDAFSALFTYVASGWQAIGGGAAADAAKAGLDSIAAKFQSALTSTSAVGKSFADDFKQVWNDHSAAIKEATDKATEILAKGDKDGTAIGEHFISTMKEIMANIKGLAGGMLSIDVSGGVDTPKPKLPEMPSMEKMNAERMSDLEAELHKEEMGWGIHWDQLKEFEAAFWAGILSRTDKNAKDYNAVFNKMFSSQEALAHDHVAKEAARESEFVSTQKAISDIRIKEEKEVLDTQVELGVLTNTQKIAKLKELTQAEYDEDLKRLHNEFDTVGQLPDYYTKINDKILILQEKHNNDMAGLNRQAAMDAFKGWDGAVQSIQTSMDTMLSGVLQGTTTFTQSMKNLWNNLILTLIEYEAKLLITHASNAIKEMVINNTTLASWFGVEAAKTTASVVGSGVRSATAVEESATGMAASVAAGSLSIENDAFKAAAGAYASAADIPYVGWLLAPAAGAAAFAAVSSFDVLSAAQGMVVPAGINPMVQLHEKEMVLPANLSTGVQDMVSGGGRGGSGLGGGDTVINVNVAGTNATPDQIASAIAQAVRDFHPAFRR